MTRRGLRARWGPVWAVALRETRGLVRERTVLVAVLVQLLVAGFSAFLAVGLLGLYDPDAIASRTRADVAYVAGDGMEGLDGIAGEAGGRTFADVLLGAPGLRVQRPDAEAAVAGLRSGRIEAVVEERLGDGGLREVTILVPDGSLEGVLLVTQLRALLQDYERELREANAGRLQQQLIDVEGPPEGTTVPYAFLYGTLLPILVLTPVFLSGAVAADGIVAELQRRTLGLLQSSPATMGQLVAGKLLPSLALAPLQVLLWCGLLWANRAPVGHVTALLGLTLAWTAMLAGAGAALASAMRRQGTAQASYAVLVLLAAPLAVLLPRDPFNLVALLGAGRMDGSAWATYWAWVAAGAAALAAGLWWTARRLRPA